MEEFNSNAKGSGLFRGLLPLSPLSGAGDESFLRERNHVALEFVAPGEAINIALGEIREETILHQKHGGRKNERNGDHPEISRR